MRELRFGSYSTVATVPGMPYLSRLKSMMRSLTPSNGLCGLSVVMSSVTSFVAKRSDGVIGRNDLIGIVFIPLPARLILGCASFLKSVACGYYFYLFSAASG